MTYTHPGSNIARSRAGAGKNPGEPGEAFHTLNTASGQARYRRNYPGRVRCIGLFGVCMASFRRLVFRLVYPLACRRAIDSTDRLCA